MSCALYLAHLPDASAGLEDKGIIDARTAALDEAIAALNGLRATLADERRKCLRVHRAMIMETGLHIVPCREDPGLAAIHVLG